MEKLPNWVDLIVVIVFLRISYNGFNRGLWTELLQFCGVVAATGVAVTYYGFVTSFLEPWLRFGPYTSSFLVFSLLFLIILFTVHIVVRKISEVVNWERLHGIVLGLGMVVGSLRGLWWAGLILIILTSSGVTYLHESVMDHSIIGPRFEPRAREYLTKFIDRFPRAEQRKTALIPRMQ